MLQPFGISALAEGTYRALLERGPSSPAEIAAVLGCAVETAADGLGELEAHDLAGRTGTSGNWYAVAPDVAVEALVAREYQVLRDRRRELDRIQAEVAELVRSGVAAKRLHSADSTVEVAADTATTVRRCANLQRMVQGEILAFDRTPYDMTADTPYPPAAERKELDMLARGIEIRAIYDYSALRTPGRFEVIQELVAAGEQARTLPEVPMKLVVYDRAHAVVQLEAGDDHPTRAMFVHASGLLDALVQLFDVMWERAVPVVPVAGTERAGQRERALDTKVLALLTAGFKDEAIARQLGVSKATVTRRIARLMEDAGAASRFQLGLQANRRGWV